LFKLSSFGVLQVQASIGYYPLDLHTGAFLALCLRRYGSRFDGIPNVRNLLPGSPSDTPYIFLTNKENTLRLQASHSRMDLFQTKQSEHEQIDVEKHWEFAGEVFEDFVPALNLGLKKLIGVTSLIQRLGQPASALKRYFCGDRFQTDVIRAGIEHFEIAFNRTYPAYSENPVFTPQNSYGPHIINMIHIKDGYLLSYPDGREEKAEAVTIRQDISTVEVDQVRPLNWVKEFFSRITIESRKMTDQYFPHESSE